MVWNPVDRLENAFLTYPGSFHCREFHSESFGFPYCSESILRNKAPLLSPPFPGPSQSSYSISVRAELPPTPRIIQEPWEAPRFNGDPPPEEDRFAVYRWSMSRTPLTVGKPLGVWEGDYGLVSSFAPFWRRCFCRHGAQTQ